MRKRRHGPALKVAKMLQGLWQYNLFLMQKLILETGLQVPPEEGALS